MADTVSLPGIANLADGELLNLYLSLSPESRGKVFITTAHAAEITGVSMRTIQLWIECGAVRAIAVGKKYQVVLESLRAYLEGQMKKAAHFT